MPVTINLHHLKKKSQVLQGEMAITELQFEGMDDCVQLGLPLTYELEAQLLSGAVLVRGSLQIILHCTCVRCLKSFDKEIRLDDWICELGFEGETGVKLTNDCVDLTPHIREDILLAFPQHPLCEAESCRIPDLKVNQGQRAQPSRPVEDSGSPWAALDKLKL